MTRATPAGQRARAARDRPLYQLVVKQRIPFDLPFSWRREWASALLNDLAVAAVALCWVFGWKAVLAVQLSLMLVAGVAGVWVCYVQHQLEPRAELPPARVL